MGACYFRLFRRNLPITGAIRVPLRWTRSCSKKCLIREPPASHIAPLILPPCLSPYIEGASAASLENSSGE
jgi:hypothetical protein